MPNNKNYTQLPYAPKNLEKKKHKNEWEAILNWFNINLHFNWLKRTH